VAVKHGSQGAFIDERNVAAQDNDIARELLEFVPRTENGMAGAELLFLKSPREIRTGACGANLLGAMADHDDDLRSAKASCSGHRMHEQWFSGQRVEDFGEIRFHSGPLSCCQNDYCHGMHTKSPKPEPNYSACPGPNKAYSGAAGSNVGLVVNVEPRVAKLLLVKGGRLD
jgi:hypothetical protein